MPEHQKRLQTLHENLDTAYVNLAALVRYFEQREFTGLIHVVLDEYEAQLLLRAGEETRVREVNHATGAASEGAAALQRLLVRARDAGGLVSVYEGDAGELKGAAGGERPHAGAPHSPEDVEWRDLLQLASELVAAIERAARIAGGDFNGALHAARLSLTEDYPFLDPLARRFDYTDGTVHLTARTSPRLFVSGINELLRRTVERIATLEQKIGVRKDVARELSIVLRRRQTVLARHKIARQQLERIAGMRLL